MANVRLFGETSGFVELAAPNAAGNNTVTLPTTGTELVASDGTGNVTFDGVATFAVGASGTPAIAASGDANTGIYFPAADTIGFAEGGNEAGRFDSSGRFLVGTNSAITGIGAGARTQIRGNTAVSAGGAKISLQRDQAASSIGTGEEIGQLVFSSNDGGDYALITGRSDGTSSSTSDCPGRLEFSTTADGASSPTERMRIRNDGDTAVFTSRTDGTCIQADSSGAANTTAITFAGKHSSTGTFNGTISFKVTTNGNVTNTNNSYGSLSDIKLKENIVDAGSQWDDLKAIQVRNYNFKEETGHQTHTQLGVIAQEIELVSPGLVTETPDRDDDNNDLGTTTKSVNYSVLYMKSVKALQEAMIRIEALETANASLEARLTALESA